MRYIYRGQEQQKTANSTKEYLFRIISLILLVALIILSVLFARNVFNPSNEKLDQNIRLMANNELRLAMSEAENLSRTGNSNTANSIARVKQYLHGIEVLNNLNVQTKNGVRLVPQQLLMNSQAIIDSLYTQLQTGQTTNNELESLLKILKEIQSSMSFSKENQ